MSTKKPFVQLISFLESNKDKKVSDILAEVKVMAESKKNAETVLYLDEDKKKPFAVFCYYHKKWELIKECEYGKKSSSASGLNTMCKEGTNQWTKQQSEAKRAKAALLDGVADGSVKPTELKQRLDAIELERVRIVPREDKKGSDKQPTVK